MFQGHAAARAAEACSVSEVLDHVAGKWSVGILVALADGPVRFTDLERAVDGISRRMLALTLRRLERNGLVVRTVHPTVPPKVEYELTDLSRELSVTLTTLTEWAQRHRPDIVAARSEYDRSGSSAARSGEPGTF